MAARKHLIIGDLRAGRNGADATLSLPDTQCVEALNVDFYEGTLGRKRSGSTSMALSSPISGLLNGYLSSLCMGAHAYGTELFYVANDAPYLVAHKGQLLNYWNTVRFGDAIASNPEDVTTAVFNNRTYFCFDSEVDRLHFWTGDSNHAPTDLYRVGLPAPTSAPTAAAGSPPGNQYGQTRYYKVAWITKYGTDIENRSELSDAVTFDPPTTAGPVRVTQPAVPSGENITHWEVYASTDDDLYHLLSTVAIATTTYDDSDDPASYDGDAPPVVGANTVPGSWKFIASDGNRLLGAGNWEGGTQSRVWFTPVYGASDVGDSERVPPANYVDVDAYDNDAITGIVGSFLGNTVVFKSRAIWRLVRTGDADAPYTTVCLTRAIGCVAPKSICVGEDESGGPALYFMSHRGPYRLGTGGLEYCGRDVQDLTDTMNQSATVISHAVWHPSRHQVWFWIATGSNSYPSTILVFDVHRGQRGANGVRGGWSKFTGPIATARCSIAWHKDGTGGGAYVDTVPWVGSSATTTLLLRCDQAGVTTDNYVPFQAYVKTKPYALAGLGVNCGVSQSHMTAKAGDNVTITLTLDRDYGAETRTSQCSLTAQGLETRVQRQFEGSDLAGAGVVQFQLGDAAASSQTWVLDALMVPYTTHEER